MIMKSVRLQESQSCIINLESDKGKKKTRWANERMTELVQLIDETSGFEEA